MLLFIICTLLKKYGFLKENRANSKASKFTHRFIEKLFIRLMSVLPMVSLAQNSQLNYKIMQRGNDIGWLHLEKKCSGDKSEIVLISEIKAKIIFPFTMLVNESSSFENGKLIYSSQTRKTNGTLKLDKKTRLIADRYEVSENGEKEKLSFPFIGINLLCLFFQEPTESKSVYCDKQERFINITKTVDGGYKMNFSNENSNCYYYDKGICTKIKIKHKLYSAEIIINPQNNRYANN